MQERLLWARLSVFAGSFDLEAAEYVCAGDGLEAEDVLDLLDELVGKSVVLGEDSAFGVRFRLLDTLRDYGGQWLRAAGEEQRLLRRHRDWYLGVATWGEVEWFGPRQAETAERTELAHPNLRAALEFCLAEPGEEQIALLLAGTLWFYWVGCGHLGEGRHWLDRALALDREPTEARAKALWVTGHLATLQGDLETARPALEECRRQALDTGDDRALAYAVHRQGSAALIGDEPDRAAELFEEALWHYRTIGEPQQQRRAGHGRAGPRVPLPGGSGERGASGSARPASCARSTASSGRTRTCCTRWRTRTGWTAQSGRPAPWPGRACG